MYLFDEHMYEVAFANDIGEIAGFNVNFSGTGMIDFLRLTDGENELVYSADLE